MSRPRVRFGEGRVLQFRIELDGITPLVWRRLLLSDRASLHELHEVIERSMGRDAGGSYAFQVDGVRYTDPGESPLRRDAAQAALDGLGLHPGARLLHVAEDHAEPWRHVITLEQISVRLVGQRVPSCIAGARAGPPDACAGPRAYRELLDALADPTDPRAADWRTWLPEDFDPGYADVTAINAALARVPKRRPAA